ncbi:hypothetical protein FGO68_gene9184 [Halteria grandinella]|uniref:Uncharacterized protein n=1 Tax=Halteria grandinella TaxID=5974 RepID=A0A8J8N989_HALGN|nr:hypothetical protein FGO68_gene9184 [Halteria grandinella]
MQTHQIHYQRSQDLFSLYSEEALFFQDLTQKDKKQKKRKARSIALIAFKIMILQERLIANKSKRRITQRLHFQFSAACQYSLSTFVFMSQFRSNPRYQGCSMRAEVSCSSVRCLSWQSYQECQFHLF